MKNDPPKNNWTDNLIKMEENYTLLDPRYFEPNLFVSDMGSAIPFHTNRPKSGPF